MGTRCPVPCSCGTGGRAININPQTCGSAVKIKTLFQQSRIPMWERRTWPVITR